MKMRIFFFICCTFLLVAGYLFYDQYWQWRSCFNEEGNCFDEASATVYHAQSGMVWGGVTLALLISSLYSGYKLLRR